MSSPAFFRISVLSAPESVEGADVVELFFPSDVAFFFFFLLVLLAVWAEWSSESDLGPRGKLLARGSEEKCWDEVGESARNTLILGSLIRDAYQAEVYAAVEDKL